MIFPGFLLRWIERQQRRLAKVLTATDANAGIASVEEALHPESSDREQRASAFVRFAAEELHRSVAAQAGSSAPRSCAVSCRRPRRTACPASRPCGAAATAARY